VAVANGGLRLLGAEGGGGGVDESQRALYEEMIAFPHGEHDDLLDAAAMRTSYLLTRPEPMIW
jgi:hypothetical protein